MKKTIAFAAVTILAISFTACKKDSATPTPSVLTASKTTGIKQGEPVIFKAAAASSKDSVRWIVSPSANTQITATGSTASILFKQKGQYHITATYGGNTSSIVINVSDSVYNSADSSHHNGGTIGNPADTSHHSGGTIGNPADTSHHSGGTISNPADTSHHSGGTIGNPADTSHHSGGTIGNPADTSHHSGGTIGNPADTSHHSGGTISNPADSSHKNGRTATVASVLIPFKASKLPAAISLINLADYSLTGAFKRNQPSFFNNLSTKVKVASSNGYTFNYTGLA